MKVTNYEDWQKAVSKEYTKLAEVSLYLNENGKERLMAFDTLSTEMCFHDSAAVSSLEDVISSLEDMT